MEKAQGMQNIWESLVMFQCIVCHFHYLLSSYLDISWGLTFLNWYQELYKYSEGSSWGVIILFVNYLLSPFPPE